MARLGSVVVALAVASCGGSNGSGTPSDLSSATKAKWDAYCADRLACLPSANCPPSTCVAMVAEEEPLIEFIDCQNAKTCGANDDECVASAGTTDAEREAFTARCEAALAAVPSSATCYVDPVLCTIVAYPLIRRQYMHAVDACLTVPCPDLQTCVEAAIEPLNCF